MTSSGTTVIERYESALATLAALNLDVRELRNLDETTVLTLNELHAKAGRLLGAAGAVIAGDLAYRSRPQLGGDGLARRTGHRTVENLLKHTTGATKEQVDTAVRTGTLLTEIADDGTVDAATGELHTATQPWLRPVAEAVGSGAISTSASNSIGVGLRVPNSGVSVDQLTTAAASLVAEAIAGVDADRLLHDARSLRDELDLAGVKIREEESRALRGLTHHPLPTGGGLATWRMDPETYALFVDAYDRMTSPKRGGVRFVDSTKAEQARRIEEDDRDYKQLASDGFVHLLMVGGDADDSVMLGSGAPVIRVTVAQDAVDSGIGLARIDGQSQPISIDTVKRLMETGKTIRVGFDPSGTYLEVFDDPAAENRLYNSRQREVLAAKFGGCMDPDSDRPPSWTEAHHIRFVKRDGGKTTISNAILLCKYRHLLYHNRGYEILQADDGTYWKIAPTSVDPAQTPIPMPLKTRNLADLRTAARRRADCGGDSAGTHANASGSAHGRNSTGPRPMRARPERQGFEHDSTPAFA